MATLALIILIIVIMQERVPMTVETYNLLLRIDRYIWGIFVIDYFARLIYVKDKKHFIRTNKIDLITIMPFELLLESLRIVKFGRIMRLSRLARLLRVTRGVAYFARIGKRFKVFMKTNNFNYILTATITVIVVGAVLIARVESMNFTDALWWSFVTATTVGYGDLSPVTNIGRIIASVLMIVGIGFIGMLTGTISTYFLSHRAKEEGYRERVIEDIKNQLDDFDKLSQTDVDDICHILKTLKIKKHTTKH